MTTTQIPPTVTGGGGHRVPEPGPGKRDRGNLFRLLSRGFGQTILTIGLVLLLFLVYEVWVTNLFADREQSKVHSQFQQLLDNPMVGSASLPLPGSEQATIPAGQGIANIYIPKFGRDFVFTIVQGYSQADLELGPVHYVDSAMPGQTGNFAVAGHRVGKGEPFLNLDKLVPGDAVVIQVPGFWYVYHVLGQGSDLSVKDKNGVPGQAIVDPDTRAVIAPTPFQLGSQPSGQYLTMTTCTPKYSASQRLIVFGTLAETKPASGKELPKELGGTL